ncbi:hypothetical protein SAMD00079811_53560 [Scytonema sp. HK-05]|uniref:hypothetical protein n=1 Tax=Scytonema sp. HK-05 TaxID=1137095 RepID=UPI0009371A09|nr:hypothetical protein [Scytonema sp. HK-05]OKH48279.1 hypothetical protein NIES2130_35355 [Scytonema sp. HK-05]BAY47737.1 hypothetical protein SAMD00079811_53560 [Scytonema sp. HK-05]
MQPNDIISVTAFQNALAKLNQSLPADIQKQLHAIAQDLKADPTNIGNLDIIAESYPPLDEVYQKELTTLKKEAGQRNKGLPPLPLPKESNKELTNSAIDTFSADDSVTAAKAKPNLLKRLWQSIPGRK